MKREDDTFVAESSCQIGKANSEAVFKYTRLDGPMLEFNAPA